MLDAEFDAASKLIGTRLETLPPSTRMVMLHDVDADGVCAGVVWQRVLERLECPIVRVQPDRERNAWTTENRRRLSEQNPEFLWILDLGSQSNKVLEGIPTCFIDHHRPEGVPSDDLLISGYAWEPIPNTSWMVYEIGQRLTNMEGLDWIAAIGTLSDLGEKAPWPVLADAKKKYTAKWLKEATALVNAPRRASNFNPEAAARALLAHTAPRELCESDSPDVSELKTARAEVAAEMEKAKRAAPQFAGPVALICIDSPCQIHPLIAQIWRGRLPKYHVLCSNVGYMPGRVNFSARSARGQSVLDLLKSIELSPGEGHFGHGHDQASGGSLPPARWHELLQKLGFALSTVQ